MNTRQAWGTAEDDWTPNEPTLRVIQRAVKGFKDYWEWLPVLESLEQDFRSWQKQEQGRPTT